MKRLFYITSDASSESDQRALLFKIGERHCCFAITDIKGEKNSCLAYYSFDEADENSLNTVFIHHPELNRTFDKIAVCFGHPKSILIPFNYFQPENSLMILKTIYGINGNEFVLTEVIPEWQLNNISAIPKETNDFLVQKFSSAKYFHAYTIGMKNIGVGVNFRIDFRTDEFSLIVVKENKLLLAQTFMYSTPEDVLYYLLKTTQQFSFSQTEVKLLASGLIEKESALYNELNNYFLNTGFRNAEWEISDGNEYPSHFFTSLNDLAKCAL